MHFIPIFENFRIFQFSSPWYEKIRKLFTNKNRKIIKKQLIFTGKNNQFSLIATYNLNKIQNHNISGKKYKIKVNLIVKTHKV